MFRKGVYSYDTFLQWQFFFQSQLLQKKLGSKRSCSSSEGFCCKTKQCHPAIQAILEYFIVPTNSLPYDQNTSFHNLCSPVLRLIKEMLETVAVQWKETSRETQPQTLVYKVLQTRFRQTVPLRTILVLNLLLQLTYSYTQTQEDIVSKTVIKYQLFNNFQETKRRVRRITYPLNDSLSILNTDIKAVTCCGTSNLQAYEWLLDYISIAIIFNL